MKGEQKQVGTLLDVELYHQIKVLAMMHNRRIGDVVNDAMEEYLKRHPLQPTKVRRRS